MNRINPPLTKEDTKVFIKKSNKLIRHLNKQIILSTLMGDKTKKARYIVRRDSLIKNKKMSNYPSNFVEEKKRVAVYTVLYGDYDTIKPIKTKNPLCDYYIFTDQPVPDDSGWKLAEFVFPKEVGSDPILKNRYLKMHPHLLFPNYEYSIYLDAVIEISLDIYRLLSRMDNRVLGLFDHHQKADCLYEEAETIKRIGKASSQVVDSQMQRYEEDGFPHHFGFCECTLIIRRHNDGLCIDIMNLWWNEFFYGARRDQLSFMYCIWKKGLSKQDIACLGATYWDEPILSSEAHKK